MAEGLRASVATTTWGKEVVFGLGEFNRGNGGDLKRNVITNIFV